MSELLITTSTFPRSETDSMPRFVYDLAQGLTKHYDRVHVLAPGGENLASEEVMRDVVVHRFTYALPRSLQKLAYGEGMVQNLQRYPWAWFLVPSYIISQCMAVRKICRQNKVSVVNSHWMVFQGLVGGLARRAEGYRHVLHIHAAGLYILFRLPRCLGGAIGRFIIKRTDHVICESSYVREKLEELTGQASGASISCMGVDTFLFCGRKSVEEDPDTLLFVGRLVEKKGVTYLLQAMLEVRSKRPKAELTIVGSGQLKESLQREARELGLLGEGVTFAGGMPHAELVKLMERSKVVAIPSIIDSRGETEGMPTVILEALAMGKNVVASRVNGTPDVIVHGRNGWLAEPETPKDLAEKLIDALQSSDASIHAEARATGEHYDWGVLSARYHSFLEKGASSPPDPA
ncbi:MAG: glycosyltransferase [Verrucomicrobia bacterium]|nr:glycosyltransferase [Verrucomicrobiota bacterium]